MQVNEFAVAGGIVESVRFPAHGASHPSHPRDETCVGHKLGHLRAVDPVHELALAPVHFTVG